MSIGKVIGPAYFVGIHRYMYKAGQPGTILRVVNYQPANSALPPRICFEVQFEQREGSGAPVLDYFPVSDLAYKLITAQDIFDDICR
jgi:hypothetical protein